MNQTSLATPIHAFSGSYLPDDVTFLLKPSSIAVTPVERKEADIQSGRRHYSEMLSAERAPDARYMELYERALSRNGARLAADVVLLADRILARRPRPVLVSLARAGTPIGVLLRREMHGRGIDAPHYSVSIIRGRGIDETAMRRITAEHDPSDIVFVDGWTGKGAIRGELETTLTEGPCADLGIDPVLAVIADPAGRADIAATFEDYLIPSGILNGIVSGLVSRSVLNDEHVGPGDYHACLYQTDLAGHDVSRAFVDGIGGLLQNSRSPVNDDWTANERMAVNAECEALMSAIMTQTGVTDRNRVKPGIAESTRAILRRVPDSVYLDDPADPDVEHIVHLAQAAGIPILPMPARSRYRAITVIKSVGSE